MFRVRGAFAVAVLALTGALAGAAEVTAEGQKLDEFLEKMDVMHLWLPGQVVAWKTGKTLRVPHDSRAHTHCSAFVAAACSRLDIYILRPPEHPTSFLANAQYDWLLGEGGQRGWQRVQGPLQAQRLANQGSVVVAVLKESNPKRHGHIAIVRPSTKEDAAILRSGPDIIQAGMENHGRTSLLEGFRHHPTAARGGVLFFAHAARW